MTLTLQQDVGFDTYLDSRDTETAKGGLSLLKLSNGSTLFGDNHILLLFDLSSLSGQTLVQTATVELYADANLSGHGTAFDLTLGRTTQTWSEATGTWSDRSTVPLVLPWGTPGAATDPSLQVQWTQDPVALSWLTSPDLTSIVQDALDNQSGLLDLRLTQDDADTGTIETFHSREAAGNTARLNMTYVVAGGITGEFKTSPVTGKFISGDVTVQSKTSPVTGTFLTSPATGGFKTSPKTGKFTL